MYDAIRAVNIPETKPGLSLWSALCVPLSTESIETLQLLFPQLSPFVENIGIHDITANHSFLNSRIQIGASLINQKSIQELSHFAKRGIPSTIRPAVWKVLLQSGISHNQDPEGHRTTFFLQEKVITLDLLMDRIVHLDSKHCQNDDSYFVFEDVVRDMLMFLIRDPWIHEQLSQQSKHLNGIFCSIVLELLV